MIIIDWFTVIAQIVNFLILVFLLRRFLYGPITKAMQAREQRIADQHEAADVKQREAEQKLVVYERRLLELDAAKDEILRETRREAEHLRQEMLSSAHNDADDLRTRWQSALQQQQDMFVRELRDRVSLHTYQIARRTLADLASVEIEQHVIGQFIERIGAMDEEMRAALTRAAQGNQQPITVVSAFDVPPDLRARIVEGIHQHIHPDTDVHFEVSPEVLSGVELKLGEQKLAWSMASYLDSLEESLSEAFNAEAMPQTTESAVVE